MEKITTRRLFKDLGVGDPVLFRDRHSKYHIYEIIRIKQYSNGVIFTFSEASPISIDYYFIDRVSYPVGGALYNADPKNFLKERCEILERSLNNCELYHIDSDTMMSQYMVINELEKLLEDFYNEKI